MPYFSRRLALRLAMAGAMLAANAASSIAIASGSANAPAGETQVIFIEPENFTDARLNRPAGGADTLVLNTIERHLQQLGHRCMAAGRSVHIRIHDIDLAGRIEWWHGPSRQTRVMNEITWPRIKLTYAVRENGQAGQDTPLELSNLAYLSESPFLRAESTPLPYERAMLTRWFEQQFCNK